MPPSPARNLTAIAGHDDSNLRPFNRETLLLQLRYVGMTKPDTWYVAFGPAKTEDSATARSTRTFKSEVDAKLFAMQILAKGLTASAGTLNPHQPKQIVPPSQIEQWADPGLGA
jgi:hypothetical protein